MKGMEVIMLTLTLTRLIMPETPGPTRSSITVEQENLSFNFSRAPGSSQYTMTKTKTTGTLFKVPEPKDSPARTRNRLTVKEKPLRKLLLRKIMCQQ